MSLRTQAWHGLTLQGSYTWSHALDYNDGDVPGNIAQNPYDWKLEYANAGFDRRQILVLSYVYNLPILPNSRGLVRSAFGGWVLSGTFTSESGTPLDTSYTGDPLGLGGTNYRPNVVGDPTTGPRSQAEWLQYLCFWADRPGRFRRRRTERSAGSRIDQPGHVAFQGLCGCPVGP